MVLSKGTLEDLKKASAQLGVDYQQLVKAVEKTEKKDNKKVDSGDKIIKTTEEEDLKDIEKKIDEAVKKITKLKNEDERIEEQISDIEEIQKQLKECKREGLLVSPESDEGGV